MIDNLFSIVGTTLAVLGALLSIVGTTVNNLKHDHVLAMRIWAWSNPMLAAWAIGYIAGIWDGALSVAALLGMYLYFAVTNWWGLRKYYQQDPLEEIGGAT